MNINKLSTKSLALGYMNQRNDKDKKNIFCTTINSLNNTQNKIIRNIQSRSQNHSKKPKNKFRYSMLIDKLDIDGIYNELIKKMKKDGSCIDVNNPLNLNIKKSVPKNEIKIDSINHKFLKFLTNDNLCDDDVKINYKDPRSLFKYTNINFDHKEQTEEYLQIRSLFFKIDYLEIRDRINNKKEDGSNSSKTSFLEDKELKQNVNNNKKDFNIFNSIANSNYSSNSKLKLNNALQENEKITTKSTFLNSNLKNLEGMDPLGLIFKPIEAVKTIINKWLLSNNIKSITIEENYNSGNNDCHKQNANSHLELPTSFIFLCSKNRLKFNVSLKVSDYSPNISTKRREYVFGGSTDFNSHIKNSNKVNSMTMSGLTCNLEKSEKKYKLRKPKSKSLTTKNVLDDENNNSILKLSKAKKIKDKEKSKFFTNDSKQANNPNSQSNAKKNMIQVNFYMYTGNYSIFRNLTSSLLKLLNYPCVQIPTIFTDEYLKRKDKLGF